MSNKREKQKNSSETTNDFETFVRESPAKLNKGQDSILHDVATLRAEVQINNASMSDISRRPTNFNQNNQERASFMELLSLERYSREYNLRFHNISDTSGEDCRQKIEGILAEQLNLKPPIENAHRVGSWIADSEPRTINLFTVQKDSKFFRRNVTFRKMFG